jgi:hypothetical protein
MYAKKEIKSWNDDGEEQEDEPVKRPEKMDWKEAEMQVKKKKG